MQNSFLFSTFPGWSLHLFPGALSSWLPSPLSFWCFWKRVQIHTAFKFSYFPGFTCYFRMHGTGILYQFYSISLLFTLSSRMLCAVLEFRCLPNTNSMAKHYCKRFHLYVLIIVHEWVSSSKGYPINFLRPVIFVLTKASKQKCPFLQKAGNYSRKNQMRNGS
jgi:hypothetical protein